MRKEDLKKGIDKLELDNNILENLKNHNIITIEDLWQTNRHILKGFKLRDKEINQIIIKLQLNGIDLNHRKY